MSGEAGSSDDRVVVGAVGKPFGVRGEVYVHPEPDIGHDFPAGQAYETERGSLTCEGARSHQGRTVVRFRGVSDRQEAEALRGMMLTLRRSDIALEEGAYWVDDLEGAEVVDPTGELVGVVEAVQGAPAHDLLAIARPDGGEILVPAVAEFVEVAEGKVVLHPIPGLIDPAEAEEA